MNRTEVLCVGQACVDVLVQGGDLDMPYASEYKRASCIRMSVGGDAANEAVVLAKLGRRVELACALGEDGAGRFIRNAMEEQKVGTGRIVLPRSGDTTVSLVLIDSAGQRRFLNAGIPEMPLEVLETAGTARIVSLASLFLPPFTNAENVSLVARPARQSGAIVCADVICGQTGCTLDDLAGSLGEIDYFFPNEEEARLITGETDLNSMADRLLSRGIGTVVIKTGARGCFAKSASENLIVPGYRVTPVDTTGAGDNFAAGFMFGLLEGKPLAECCKLGCGVAAVSIGSVGASTGVKNREQVLEMIRGFETAE